MVERAVVRLPAADDARDVGVAEFVRTVAVGTVVARAVGKRKAHLFVLKTSILSALLGRELKHVPRLVFAAGYAHRHSTRQRRHINPRVRQRRVPHAARGACVQRQRVRHALVAPLAQQPPLRLVGDVHAALQEQRGRLVLGVIEISSLF